MNFKTSSIVILFLLVSFNSHSQLDFFVKMNEKFSLEIDKRSWDVGIVSIVYPKFSTSEKTKNGLQKKLTKYQEKNSEDFTVKFFNYLLKIDKFNSDFSWFPYSDDDKFFDKYISNVKLQYDIIKEINKLSPSELEIFSKYQDAEFLVEFLDKYTNDFLIRYIKKFPVNTKLDFYNTIKDNEMFQQEIKTNFLVEIFNDFSSNFNFIKFIYECKLAGKTLFVKPNYYDVEDGLSYLKEISPEVNIESNWSEKYPFIKTDTHLGRGLYVNDISEFYSLLNYWSQSFKDIENIDKKRLGVNNYLYELMKSDSWLDCTLIFDVIERPYKFDKKDLVLIGEFLQNTNCYELNDDCNDLFKKIKYRYSDVLKSLTNNTKGYCTREKHEERIEKEYYPDNGLKITRGITRIILTESGNCKYSWEVYDTTLRGKTRISYFITRSDNPEDSTISIELIGTDEF